MRFWLLAFFDRSGSAREQWRSQNLVVVGALDKWGPTGKGSGEGTVPLVENNVFWCILALFWVTV